MRPHPLFTLLVFLAMVILGIWFHDADKQYQTTTRTSCKVTT